MRQLVLADLRRGPAAAIATFLALFLAVVTVTAFGSIFASGVGYHGTVARYAAAPVLVASTDAEFVGLGDDDGETDSVPLTERMQLPASLPGTLAALPGVDRVVGDVEIPAELTVGARAVAVEAHPWSAARLAPFRLSSGAAPAGAQGAVLSTSLASALHARAGQTVALELPNGQHEFTVSGIAATAGAAPQTPTVFLSDAEAASVAQRGAEVLAVLPQPGTSTGAIAADVSRALPAPAGGAAPLHVYTGAARGSVERIGVNDSRSYAIAIASAFGGSALLMALIVIAGTVGLSVRLRSRDIALLRAVGATPRQVRHMVVGETAAVAVLASLLGAVPGLVAARWLREQFVAHQIVPADFALHGSVIAVAIAAVATTGIAAAAAWMASRRPSRVPASTALSEAAVEPGRPSLARTVLALVMLVGGIVLSVLSAQIAGDTAASIAVGTVFTLTAATGLLGPVIMRITAAAMSPILRSFGATGRLAAANIGHNASRLGGVMSALALVVALGGSLWFLQSSEQHVAEQQANAGVVADDVVTAPAPGLSAQTVTTLRQLPGIRAATGVINSSILSTQEDGTSYTAEGVDLTGLGRTMALGVTSGNLADLSGPGTVAIDAVTAQSLHLRVGGDFRGWFGDGTPARLRVVAVYSRGLGFAQFTLGRQTLAAHTTSSFDSTVYLATDNAQAAAAVRHTLGQLAPGASLVSADRYRVGLSEELAQNAWTNRLLTVVLLAYVLIGAINTLIVHTLGRGRELALLRMAGTTRRQVRRMVGLEQAVALGLTLVIGSAIAMATLVPMVRGLTGASLPFIPAPTGIAAIAGIVLLVAVATAAALRRTLGQRPIDAVGARE